MIIIMKSKIIKRITGFAAIGLAGVLLTGTILNHVVPVQAEETLFGIESLIQEVQNRAKPYRILEIVPDAAAAEIGYYIPGYEPALSARESGTGVWTNWQEGLKELRTEAERSDYMEGLNEALEEFNALRGFSSGNAPVTYHGYAEQDEPANGYTELSFEAQVLKGYFQSYSGGTETRYDLDFAYVGAYDDASVTGNVALQYYYVENATKITADNYIDLADDDELYVFVNQVNRERFELTGTWGELKEVFLPTVSGGDASVSGGDTVSGGDGRSVSDNDPVVTPPTIDYYLIHMEPWTQDITPAYSALYVAESFEESADGEFEFVESDTGFDTTFRTDTVYYKGGFVNNEWFHTMVLNQLLGETAVFPVEVITLTVAELNAMGSVPEFDMLYLASGRQSVPGSATMVPYSVSNDISEALCTGIFSSVIANAKPCIVDASVVYSVDTQGVISLDTSLQSTYVYRLAAMFMQESPTKYYTDVVLSGVASTVPDLMAGLTTDADKNYVVESIYAFCAPTVLVGPDFDADNLYKNGEVVDGAKADGFRAVLDEIVSENLNREADAAAYELLPTDVSRATVVRHIMNYAHRRQIEVKKDIRVLEIQPAKSAEWSHDLTVEQIKEWAPGVETVEIERMTTAEFIGRIEDINEEYDLIYIGTDKDYMNVTNGVKPIVYNISAGVRNAGFENGFDGWSRWGDNNAFEITTNNGHSGKAFANAATATQIIPAEPNTTYTLSCYGKVSAAGVEGTIGVDFMRGTADNTAIQKGVAEVRFTTTDYVQKTSTFTTPEGTNYIKIYMWSGNYWTYFDDITLVKQEAVEPDFNPDVYLENTGFNNNMDGWNDWGNTEWVATGATGSNGSIRVGTGDGGYGQTIAGVAGQTYKFSGWARVSDYSDVAYYGVDCLDANDVKLAQFQLETSSQAFDHQTISFTAPAGTAKLQIYAWKNAGNGYAYYDDFSLKQVVQTAENSDKVGSVVYNDSSMDGLIYTHTGDMRYTAMELAGQLDTEYVDGNRDNNVYYFNPMRYGGNDITEEKKDALLSFLNASYPIILSDELLESAATLFEHSDWNGYSINLKPGSYNTADLEKLGVANDDISSIKLSTGYQIQVFKDINFGGDSYTFTSSTNYVGNVPGDWNDKISSVIVSEIPGQEALRTPKVDADHVDNSSYMYDFLKQAVEVVKYPNCYVRSELTSDSGKFQFYLNRPKAEFAYVVANGTANASGIHELSPEPNGKYALEYRFRIENEGAASADTKYECKLFIDVNADGKYSEGEELGDVNITQNGNPVAANELYAGREYVLRRYVPDGYKGVLPWKLQVLQNNNTNIHAGYTGYTKLMGLESETLKIIQIGRDQVTEGIPGRDKWWGGADEVLFDLETKIANPDDIYHVLIYGGTYEGEYYEGISDNFTIDVDFYKISEFEAAYVSNPHILDDYNMLILGFSDAYGNISGNAEEGPVSAIIDFIDAGKSVLFAHDTVSYFNYENGKLGVTSHSDTSQTKVTDQYHNSYNLTRYVRGLVGMDRYGITTFDVLKKGNDLSVASDSWNDLLKQGKEIAYVPKSNKLRSSGLTQGYTYAIINAKDQNSANGRYETFTADQTGTTAFTNNYLNLDYGTVFYHNNSSDDGEIKDNYNGEVTNLWVTRVNSGQITDYPYKLKDEFMVSATHNQYYQLDFTADDDDDGQSDLVVWYCLGHRTNDLNQVQETIYSASPNDVSNNYYIYNKGNITYTGVGHSANRDLTSTVEEAKLFINTMIASYNAGIKDPVVSVLEEGNVDAQIIDSAYTYMDATNDLEFGSVDNESIVAGKEMLYFSVSDPNFVKGTRTIATRCYYESDDADAIEIVCDGETVKVKELPVEVRKVSDNNVADQNNLASGGIYYALFDESFLEDFESEFSIYFEAQSTIKTNKSTVQTGKSYSKFTYTRVQLFDLD